MSTSTTTNFGWTIPNDDELVKNGAAAIRTLGQAIDTSAVDFGGLKLIETRTVTTSSAESFSNVFTSDYDYYKILYNLSYSSTSANGVIRFRNDTTDTTATNYEHQYARITATNTWAIATQNSQAQAIFHDQAVNSGEAFGEIMLYCPPTSIKPIGQAINTNIGTNTQRTLSSFSYDTASTHNGVTLYPSTGTITGSISLFGVKK